MARTKRVVAVGCPHHITQRGNYRQDVFYSEQDRLLYLALLAEQAEKYQLRLLGYCLMTNHIHLIAVPNQLDSLARAIGRAHNDYSRWFNIKNHRVGHLWQNRFFSCPLDPAHLAQAMRYVELNPARAELCVSPVDYQWSSARAHCGLESAPTWLDTAQWSARYSPQQWQEVLALDFRLAGDLCRLRTATRTGRPFGSDKFIAELEGKLDRRLFPKKRGPKPKAASGEDASDNKASDEKVGSGEALERESATGDWGGS